MIHHQIKLQTLASPLHSQRIPEVIRHTIQACIDPVQVFTSIESIRPLSVTSSYPTSHHFNGVPQLIFKLILHFGKISGWCVLCVLCAVLFAQIKYWQIEFGIWCQCYTTTTYVQYIACESIFLRNIWSFKWSTWMSIALSN